MCLLLGCGGGLAFAPVSVVFDVRPSLAPSMGSQGAIVLSATRKLNPSCTANCELGATFPDGGSGAWTPVLGASPDGGTRASGPFDVAVGSRVLTTMFWHGAEHCSDSREVLPEGFEVTVTRFADGGDLDCAFTYR